MNIIMNNPNNSIISKNTVKPHGFSYPIKINDR